MLLKDRYKGLIEYFTTNYPIAETELQYNSPFELLIAVILSAQCTDKRINLITPALFDRFPTPSSLAASNFDEVFSYIRSVSYPNNKAKHLLSMARTLVDEFGSEVPSTMENLQKLQGVGRKTANVILSVIYNQPSMAVDTHVFRVAHRLGLVPSTAKTPFLVEQKLVANISDELIPRAHHWLILHGRYVCVARNPKCNGCELKTFCKYFEKNGNMNIPKL